MSAECICMTDSLNCGFTIHIYIELYKMFHVKHSFIYIIYDLINKDVLVY